LDRSSGLWLPCFVPRALGVVYGEIGTSPLYALQECFSGSHAILLSAKNVLGVLSLIIWSLTFIATHAFDSFVVPITIAIQLETERFCVPDSAASPARLPPLTPHPEDVLERRTQDAGLEYVTCQCE